MACYTFNKVSCCTQKIYHLSRQKLTRTTPSAEVMDQQGTRSAIPWRKRHEHQRWERPDPEPMKK